MAIKKRYSLSDAVIRHIFDGEPSGNGFSGFHSEARKNLANNKMIIHQMAGDQAVRRNANRSYNASVCVLIDNQWRGPHLKSMFPMNWKETDIITWIEQALSAHTDKDRSSKEEWKTLPRLLATRSLAGANNQVKKIKINKVSCTVEYGDGIIKSVYPNIGAV